MKIFFYYTLLIFVICYNFQNYIKICMYIYFNFIHIMHHSLPFIKNNNSTLFLWFILILIVYLTTTSWLKQDKQQRSTYCGQIIFTDKPTAQKRYKICIEFVNLLYSTPISSKRVKKEKKNCIKFVIKQLFLIWLYIAYICYLY